MSNQYVMKISRLTVDKLGVKLYDKVSAVIAELVANAYDADAAMVEVLAPMSQYLAVKRDGQLSDKGFEIKVVDNGMGMTPSEVNDFYLHVGAERRNDPKRGDTSPNGRKVMGRKGVGKLAPFGICERIEVLSSGGKPISGLDEQGKNAIGYLTAHLVLERDEILQESDYDYMPQPGALDGMVRPNMGTTITLSGFSRRRVPAMDVFERQLAQRFGIARSDWGITIRDTTKTETDPLHSRLVGEFSVDKMEGTETRFEVEKDAEGRPTNDRVIGPDSNILPDVQAGFSFEGEFYPITGWVAYSKVPYKDDLMAGIRIYCRGKIAAQTSVFNLNAGFTGEHNVRSYLVGELHADWLDETEDLIQTDRRDILWSHDLGQAFEQWGQGIVKKLGKLSRDPLKKKVWERFLEVGQFDEKVEEAYPNQEQVALRETAIEVAKMFGQNMRADEVEDMSIVEPLVQLSLSIAPHITLNEQLKKAADEETTTLAVINKILKTARLAELASYGRIAEDRLRVLERLKTLKNEPDTAEQKLQELVEYAPWLINPEWAPIAENQRFSSLKQELEKYYKERTGVEINLTDFSDPAKRPDFVMSNHDKGVELVEIKKPAHALQNAEMDRIITYHDVMRDFLNDPGNKDFKDIFPDFHITLVCDKLSLTGAQKAALEKYQDDMRLTHLAWRVLLFRTEQVHKDFLVEANKQRAYVTSK